MITSTKQRIRFGEPKDAINETNDRREERHEERKEPFPMGANMEMSDSDSDEGEQQNRKNVFIDNPRKSFIHVNEEITGNNYVFKRMVHFFADRKFIMIAFVHLAITLTVFTHFALEKYNSQRSKVPGHAPRYNWKIYVPTFEFGTMHAILLQLAALPLTMCRLIISKASGTFLNNIIPFNEALKCHIAIGYTLVFMLFLTIIVFLMFFGVNCADGDQTFCSKFISEIMITGYVIFGLFLLVGTTSYFRAVIPYRVFYVLHHLVFITYAVTIAHTIDHVQRNKGGRSQTFKWFSASILLYITDRATMYLNERYASKIMAGSTIVESTDGKKMIILEVKKPELFYFYPGQYVYLKVPSVNDIWHPFSVASSPDAKKIAFYIEVFGESSWTYRLYEKISSDIKSGKQVNWTFSSRNVTTNENEIEIMGPYGTSLGNTAIYSHALVIGAGTGIVPILSMFQSHVNQLMNLDADRRIDEKKKHHAIVAGLHKEKKERGGSFLDQLFSVRTNKSTKLSTSAVRRWANWQIYKYIIMFFGTLLGVAVLGITISWNLLSFEAYNTMKRILYTGTLIFQSSFVILTLIAQNISSIWFMIDVIFIILGGLADWNFFAQDLWGNFGSMDLFMFIILTGYKVLRYWTTLLRLTYNPIRSANKRRKGVQVLNKLHLIWTARSSTLISQIFPDIEMIWNELVQKFGEDMACELCEIDIYCTSKDEDACDDLYLELANSSLCKMGALKFHRPSFPHIFRDHATKRMDDLSLPVSRTLLAFCGSPRLGNEIKEAKIINDLAKFVAGVSEHQMDLVIESYGGTKPKEKGKSKTIASNIDTNDDKEQAKLKLDRNVSVVDQNWIIQKLSETKKGALVSNRSGFSIG